ncbi:hypothetical protein MC81_31045 (plasmid) [Achromobacter insolitus]|nr:hypothetical protein MC81_31045 [Achromobacter insolitus]
MDYSGARGHGRVIQDAAFLFESLGELGVEAECQFSSPFDEFETQPLEVTLDDDEFLERQGAIPGFDAGERSVMDA